MNNTTTAPLIAESALTNSRVIKSVATLCYLIFGTLAALLWMGDFTNTGDLVIALNALSVAYCLSLLIKLPERRMPFRFGGKMALYYSQLFNLFTVVSGLCAALFTAQTLSPLLTAHWFDTPLESLVDPVLTFICLVTGILVTGCLLWIPRFLRASVLAGRLEAAIALDILRLGACWLWYVAFLLIYAVIRHYPNSLDDLPLVRANPCVFLTAWGSILGYAMPYLLASAYQSRRQLNGMAASQPAGAVTCWLVFNEPVKKWELQLIDRIAALCKNRPFTLVAPAGSTTFGQHQFWAIAAKRLKLLFPTRSIAIQDWRRVTPSAGIGLGLPMREIYPAAALMPETITTLRAEQDLVLIMHDSYDMEHWRGRLPENQTFVLMDWYSHMESDERWTTAIAGYRTVDPYDDSDLAELPLNAAIDPTNAGSRQPIKADSSSTRENKTALGDFILEQIKAELGSTVFAQTIFRQRKKLIVVSLLILLAAVFWLSTSQCFYYDPPFECKFNQRE